MSIIVGAPTTPIQNSVAPQSVDALPSIMSGVSYEQLLVGPLLTGAVTVAGMAAAGERYKAPPTAGWFSGLFGVTVAASFAGQVTSQWILPALGIVPGSALSLSSGALIQLGVVVLVSIVFLQYMNKTLYAALGPIMIGIVAGGSEIFSQWLNSYFVQGIFSNI